MTLVAAILMGLRRRDQTGKGGWVGTSLYANGVWANGTTAAVESGVVRTGGANVAVAGTNASGNVLTNGTGADTDANGDNIFAWRVSSPASGTISFNSNGSFTYRPAAGFTGTVTFGYRAYDARFAFSPRVNVTITVAGSAATFVGVIVNDVTSVIPATGSTLTFASAPAWTAGFRRLWEMPR